MNSVAIAIDWSMRVNVRFRKSRSSSTGSRLLGLDADLRHRLDRLDRVLARRGLGRQHHRVGAVEHGVGDVGHLGARRHRVVDHRLHHLRRGDRQLVALARDPDHALLQPRHRGVADFDREVAARDHDAVGRVDDLRRARRSLPRARSSRSASARPFGGAQELARHVHVFLVLRERHGDVVGLELAAVLMSSMSFAVSAGAVRPPPRRLMPLLFDSVPPSSTRVTMRGPLTASTLRRISPSSSSRIAPGRDVARQLLVVEADAALSSPPSRVASSTNVAPGASVTRPSAKRRCGSSGPAGRP